MGNTKVFVWNKNQIKLEIIRPRGFMDFPSVSDDKESTAKQQMQETWVWSLGQEDWLEKETAIHSSSPAWSIPCTEEPGGLQSIGFQRAGHDWVTNTFILMEWKYFNVLCHSLLFFFLQSFTKCYLYFRHVSLRLMSFFSLKNNKI